MGNEVAIREFSGKIIGYIDTQPNGDKIVKDFYRKILGRYDKRLDVTKDFYGRIIGRGDLSAMLFNYKT